MTRKLFLLIAALIAIPAFAEDRASVSLSLAPRYYHLNTSGYNSVFQAGGLPAPAHGAIGYEMNLYWTTQKNWQFGLGVGDVFCNKESGLNVAEYGENYAGVWLGKRFLLGESFELDLGSLFALGFARTEVISTTANGRTDENSILLVPKLLLAEKIGSWFKLGVSGSYEQPLDRSDSVKGQALNSGHISLQGWSAGVEFIFSSEREY